MYPRVSDIMIMAGNEKGLLETNQRKTKIMTISKVREAIK